MDSNTLYFGWLVSLIDDGRADQYPTVIESAWDMEFSYSIPMDSNRANDGRDLRKVFEQGTSRSLDDLGPCKVLEFLVALAKHIDYILFDYDLGDQTQYWFWVLLANLRLTDLGNHNTDLQNREIADHAFKKVIERSYEPSGLGGLFPLRNPKEDQRYVEIWYQMHSWIAEKFNEPK